MTWVSPWNIADRAVAYRGELGEMAPDTVPATRPDGIVSGPGLACRAK